jgi:hypothetical protein
MNSASATTITVNTSLFSAGDTLVLQNISTGVCTVTAGTATVATAGSLAIPQNGSGILYFTSAGVSIYYPSAVAATTPGLVCVKAETAFTTSSAVTVDNVFSSTYTNYRIMIRMVSAGNINTSFQLRVGGVTATGANYNSQIISGSSTSVATIRVSSGTSYNLNGVNGAFFTTNTLDIYAPALAEPTSIQNHANQTDGAYTAPFIYIGNGNHTLSTSYDGFVFTPSSTTLTGTYTVYGYSKAV